MMGYGMGFGVFGLLWMLLFWGALIFLGVWLVKGLFSGDRQFPGTSTSQAKGAREILNERYARGEITPEQYERMKQDISS